MHAADHAFHQTATGVWLTGHVPPGYLSGWLGQGKISR
jgi:RNA:NAD 2'-phosphotransferase (TPT1/KptA family)